jgi:excisionase family DNA binding protein
MARPLISIPKAAAALGVSLDTMRREIAAGGVPIVRVGQRDLLDPDDLEAWRASRRHTAKPSPTQADAAS